MRDLDIRRALRHEMSARHTGGDTRVVEELGLCQGLARVDLAVVNGHLHGYEIKSERDTLIRLPAQCDVYGKALDLMTLVVSQNHLSKAMEIIPHWWEIWTATVIDGSIALQIVRVGHRNWDVAPIALAQLLWRDEALAILSERGIGKGLKGKPRRVIWENLASILTVEELGEAVRAKLKSRGSDWRPNVPPALCGDSHPLSAT